MISIKNQQVQLYLPVAVQTVLGKKSQKKLTKNEKVLLTKIIKNLNILCKMNKKQVVQFLKHYPAYQSALSQIYFDKSINNWRMITNDDPPIEEAIRLMNNNSNQCVGVEYRIEFTLSTINRKKVMRPVILLIFQLRSGKFKVCLTLEKFAELRYKVAEALKSVYSIELRTFFG